MDIQDLDSQSTFNDNKVVDGSTIPIITRGILYRHHEGKADVPMFIVERVQEGELIYVSVYGIQKGSNPPRKDIKRIEKTTQNFNNRDELGRWALKKHGKKKIHIEEDRPPLYTSPVLPLKVCTLTGKRGDAWYHRTPDIYRNNDTEFESGNLTNVLISIAAVTWQEPFMATKDILDRLGLHRATMIHRFDFADAPNSSGDTSNGTT